MQSRLRALTLLMNIMKKIVTCLPTLGDAKVKEKKEKKHIFLRTRKGAGVSTARTYLKGQYLNLSTLELDRNLE